MRGLGWAALIVTYLFSAVTAKSADLQDAFKAALGHEPPLMRRAKLENWGETNLRLEPLLLTHVGGTRFALLISESFNGAHFAEGDVGVAYLDRDSAGWRPVRVWYEFIQTGSSGTPFPKDRVWSFNFGGIPFFAGEAVYCGMGACTRWYNLIGLSPDGPFDWGGIGASGSFENELDPLPDGPHGRTGCGGYGYSSVISPPKAAGDLMRVTYSGWMIPGGSGQKRLDIQTSAEVYLVDEKAKLLPAVKLPNCES